MAWDLTGSVGSTRSESGTNGGGNGSSTNWFLHYSETHCSKVNILMAAWHRIDPNILITRPVEEVTVDDLLFASIACHF